MLCSLSLDTLCGALAYAAGIEPPHCAAPASDDLCDYIDASFGSERADRIFLYNPDAIARWIYEKYAEAFDPIREKGDLELPFCTVMPSVTPVCFATMYTGSQPSVHGIQSYEKPVIAIDTLFDAFIRGGKKPAIVSTKNDSMSKIFLTRPMDYYILDTTLRSTPRLRS